MALNRILITVPSLAPEFGGPVVKAGRLVAALRKLGHEVTLVGVGTAPDCLSLTELARFHGTPIPASLGRLRASVLNATLVHILGYRDPVGTAAALIAYKHGVRYLLEPSGMHRRRLRSVRLKAAFDGFIGARVVNRAHTIVATSALEARELQEDGLPRERIRVRPNGVNAEELLPLPARGSLRRRLKIPLDVPVVLSLGRITAKKGLIDLARALARVNGIWGVVAGPDDGDGTLRELLALRSRLELTERLAVLPEGLWGSDKAQAFADADAFCLPSATENFGNAAIEAAAVGVPVVISSACGAAEWLHPEATRIVPHADVASLAEAIREVLLDPRARAAAKKAAPGLRQTLDWDVVAREQLEIYREMMRSE